MRAAAWVYANLELHGLQRHLLRLRSSAHIAAQALLVGDTNGAQQSAVLGHRRHTFITFFKRLIAAEAEPCSARSNEGVRDQTVSHSFDNMRHNENRQKFYTLKQQAKQSRIKR